VTWSGWTTIHIAARGCCPWWTAGSHPIVVDDFSPLCREDRYSCFFDIAKFRIFFWINNRWFIWFLLQLCNNICFKILEWKDKRVWSLVDILLSQWANL
jgi:hypothetical protein